MATHLAMPREDFLFILGLGFLIACHSSLFPKMHQIIAKINFWCLLRMAWYVDTGEGADSCLPVTPHPFLFYLHHAKGCGNCHLSDMAMLYTHTTLICPGSKWVGRKFSFRRLFHPKMLIRLNWNVPWKGFDSVKAFSGNNWALARLSDGRACLACCQLTRLPMDHWPFGTLAAGLPSQRASGGQGTSPVLALAMLPAWGSTVTISSLTSGVGILILKASLDSFLVIFFLFLFFLPFVSQNTLVGFLPHFALPAHNLGIHTRDMTLKSLCRVVPAPTSIRKSTTMLWMMGVFGRTLGLVCWNNALLKPNADNLHSSCPWRTSIFHVVFQLASFFLTCNGVDSKRPQ